MGATHLILNIPIDFLCGDIQVAASKSSVSGVWRVQVSLSSLLAEQDLLVTRLHIGGVT